MGRAAIALGLAFTFAASALAPRSAAAASGAAPYPALQWIAAAPQNQTPLRGGKGARPEYIVIHDTEISFDRTIGAFQNPRSRVSAHYVIRGSDGFIVQMVADWDEAWHSGNFTFNRYGIGIEHELDRVTNPQFTLAQYQASAKLVCGIASRYDIPLDRAHIVGHNEVPWPSTHRDPGPTWNWPYYMGLVHQCGEPRLQASAYHSEWVAQQAPSTLGPNVSAPVTVYLRNAGDVSWIKGTPTEARLGVRGDNLGPHALGYAVGWVAPTRPAAQSDAVVPPGATTAFTFSVRGAAPGALRLYLRPVIDGVAWLEDQGIFVDLTVR